MSMNRKEREAYLVKHLKKFRVQHSLGVEETCAAMAKRFGLDPKLAARAGLIHDCAKGLSKEEQRAAIAAEGLELDELWLSIPELLHGPAGVHIARIEMGEEDPAVLDAICHHTIPAREPTDLAKIVFIADIIEPNRDFDGVGKLRRAACKDLNRAFLLTLSRTLIYNLEQEHPVHPRTLEVYNRLQAVR